MLSSSYFFSSSNLRHPAWKTVVHMCVAEGEKRDDVVAKVLGKVKEAEGEKIDGCVVSRGRSKEN